MIASTVTSATPCHPGRVEPHCWMRTGVRYRICRDQARRLVGHPSLSVQLSSHRRAVHVSGFTRIDLTPSYLA
jgi:hypothetical protein